MANNLKVILTSGIDNNDLTLSELCSLLKQIIIFKDRKLINVSESANMSYAGLVRLLGGFNSNPTVKILDNIASEIGYTLSYSLKEKITKKKESNKRGKSN